jgi:hypothetical protein
MVRELGGILVRVERVLAKGHRARGEAKDVCCLGERNNTL